jgi:hypothetical protein
MDARTALLKTNDMLSMRPLVVFAIRVMAPGPRRLRMVKLAHEMNDGGAYLNPSHRTLRVAPKSRPQGVVPSRRAA